MLNRISKATLMVIVAELCLGGGGRLTALGPVSMRMILFGLAILLTILLLIEHATLARKHWEILTAFVLMIAVGAALGWINQSSKASVWEDVKPLLYFLMLPFFVMTIDQKEITSISKIIKIS